MNVWNAVKSFAKDEDGAALVEYGLLLAIIALGAVATMTTLAGDIGTLFSNVGTKLTAAPTT